MFNTGKRIGQKAFAEKTKAVDLSFLVMYFSVTTVRVEEWLRVVEKFR